jgi:D-alanine-D-alanine ligase-like ATP-grasp enzyme
MNQETINNWTGHGGIRSFLKRASECGVKILTTPGQKRLLKLSHDGDAFFLHGSRIPVARRMGNLTENKEITKIILNDIGIRTPHGIVAHSIESAIELIRKSKMQFPFILKPTHGSRALGVTWNIQSENDLLSAFSYFKKIEKAQSFEKDSFLVEEMFIGNEYRILVLNGKVISCVQKVPASITGDGKSTIKKLVNEFNKTRIRGFKIRIDVVVENTLKENSLVLESILPKNYTLKLRNNLNMSDGGRSIDVTTSMHSSFRDICISATRISGLSFSGMDVIAKDIEKSARRDNYVVLELNPNPYYNMNEKPLAEGKGIDVSFLLLKQLFPGIKSTPRHQ